MKSSPKLTHTAGTLVVHDRFYDPTICLDHGDGTCHIIAELGVTEGVTPEQAACDADRFVACWNALSGIEDPEKWVEEAKEAILLNEAANDLGMERDTLT